MDLPFQIGRVKCDTTLVDHPPHQIVANVQRRRRELRHRSYSPPPSPSFHSMSSSSRDGSGLDCGSTPQHPVPSMQAAFEESILDLEVHATSNSDGIVSSSQGWKSHHCRSKNHQLLKVVSQIAFGIHLLHAGLAKSDPEVVHILRAHVNDIDLFLSATTDDIELARLDIDQRLKNLRIPLESGRALEVFDQMLEDRKFRLEIVRGNENIEYVISQTEAAMEIALIDVREGLSAVDELAKYLLGLKRGWKDTNLIRVYAAMTLNVEQWFRELVGLQAKGTGLNGDLEQLRRVMGEIEKRTGIASRKDRASIVLSSRKSCPALTANINKPLPMPPASDSVLIGIDIRTAIPKRSRSQPAEKRVTIVTEEKQPSRHGTLQRLLSRARTRPKGPPEQQLEYEKQKRLSRLRTQPVPEVWPEPLPTRSGELVEGEQRDYVFNLDKVELKRKTSKKGSKRPESCVLM